VLVISAATVFEPANVSREFTSKERRNMTARFSTHTLLTGVILAGIAATQASAQSTWMNLSAANCIPRSAGAFQGSGSDGFQWDDSGATLNRDDNDNEDLICAVPYDPSFRRSNGTMPVVDVTVDVIDGHTTDLVKATLYGQNGNAGSSALASATTSNLDAGRRSLRMSITPATGLRYLWLRITLPDSENYVRSGVVGYQVRRY
jgi:hypothetical protein